MQHGGATEALRLLALGGLLQRFRAGKGWSAQSAAEHAGVGHMAWGRCEDGVRSRSHTYAALDRLFGLPDGSVKRATGDDHTLVLVAKHLGVQVPHRWHAATWVRRFAADTVSDRLGVPVTVGAVSDEDAVSEMVDRVRGWDPETVDADMVRELSGVLTDHAVARIRWDLDARV